MSKEYKIGDLVRVTKDTAWIKKGEIKIIETIMPLQVIVRNTDNSLCNLSLEHIEPVTHLTTKEFITLVEDMGYEAVTYLNSIGIVKGFEALAYVSSDIKNSLDTDVDGTGVLIGDNFFKVLTLYANTPLELREEKEQLFTLQCPLTKKYLLSYLKSNNEFTWENIVSDEYSRCKSARQKFTQKEIDSIENQEYVKQLKQVPVNEA